MIHVKNNLYMISSDDDTSNLINIFTNTIHSINQNSFRWETERNIKYTLHELIKL